jgi:hypothetical protein
MLYVKQHKIDEHNPESLLVKCDIVFNIPDVWKYATFEFGNGAISKPDDKVWKLSYNRKENVSIPRIDMIDYFVSCDVGNDDIMSLLQSVSAGMAVSVFGCQFSLAPIASVIEDVVHIVN